MTEPGCRRLAALSCNKNIFCVVSLLLLVYTGQSLAFEEKPLTMLREALRKLKEGFKLLKEDQSGTDIILLFLDMANSTANKKQLKIFQQYLQEAVDETYRQKIEKASGFAADTQLFNLMMLENYPKLQQLKISSNPLIKRLHEVLDRALEACSSYLALKKEVFTGKIKETERKLEDTLKDLCSPWFNPHFRMAIFYITLFCTVALFGICCHTFAWICSHLQNI